jgi:hypothetical protein
VKVTATEIDIGSSRALEERELMDL